MSAESRSGINSLVRARIAVGSGVTERTTGERRLLAGIVAALAGLLLILATPGIASAQDNLTDQKKDKTTLIGKTLDFGVVAQDQLPAMYQIYIRTDNSSGGCTGGSNCNNRNVDINIRLNDPAYEYGGGNCDERDPDEGWTFQARLRYKSNSGGNCSINLHLKEGTAPGNYDTTLDFAAAFGGWNGPNQPGSATILGTVTAESGNVIRTYDSSETEISVQDFGEVAVDDAVTRTITLVNRGTTVVTGAGRSLTGSDAYSIESTDCGETLALNSSCSVTVKYEPTVSSELDEATLAFTSGSGHSTSVQLSGTAIGPSAGLTVTPASADLGTTPAGVPVHRDFTVQNSGNTNLNLTIAVDPGPHAGQVELTEGTTPCGALLAVGDSCEIRAGFSPNESGEPHQTASFTVTGTSPLVAQPVSGAVSLSVERVAPVAAIEVLDADGGNPVSELSFGDVPVGTSAERDVMVSNAGNVAVPSLATTFESAWSDDFEVLGSTCGELPRDGSCTLTVRYTASTGAAVDGALVLTPGEAPVRAEPVRLPLSAQGSGVRILNDQIADLTNVNQKVWVDTLTAGAAASPGDRIRVAFEVEKGVAETIEDLLVSTTLPKSDTVPEPESFVPVPNGLGKVEIQSPPGSGTAFVVGEFPAVSIYGANVKTYGLDDDSGTRSYLGQQVPYTCGGNPTTGIGDGNGGESRSNDRRVWLRLRTASGQLSQIVGSIVRFSDARIPRACGGGTLLYDQQVTEVGGVEQPPATLNAVADQAEPVSFSFRTNASRKAAQDGSPANVNGIGWRIRNSHTGAMFVRNVDQWVACAEPCTSEGIFTTAAGNSEDYSDSSPDLVRTLNLPYGLPARGRWIVEATIRGTDRTQTQFQQVGSVLVNSIGDSPTINLEGAPPNRPDTGSEWTLEAEVGDPLDPTGPFDAQGGSPQVIEWDLNNDPGDGPAGDGFELRYEARSGEPLPAGYLTRDFTTAGKEPGPYTVRVRVTDNGAINSADTASRSKTASASFVINSSPQARTETVDLDADDQQPATVDFKADDPDGDPYTVEVTGNAGNTGSLEGTGNSRSYSWPATFTGSDRFEFVATDDKAGEGPAGEVTLRVRPDTEIGTAEIPAVLHNGDPDAGYLGATTATSAGFSFSSPQNPVVGYECRHQLDGEIVSDWSECAGESTGEVELENLEDGQHRLEVRAVNDEGMADGSPARRDWRVDTTGPEAEVLSGPDSGLAGSQPRPTNETSPVYRFRAAAGESSPQQHVSYECRALWGPESGTWMPCGDPADDDGSGPVPLVGEDAGFGIAEPLGEGIYEIEVRATDEVGNQGPVLRESFLVDLTAPVTSVSSGPDGLVAWREVAYSVTSTEPDSTFRCELTGQSQGLVFPAAPCPGGHAPSFTGLADDVYQLTITALDPGTNPDPEPPTVNFEVDATAPLTTDLQVDFGEGPTGQRTTGSRRVTVDFDGSDNRAMDGFQCRIDSDQEEDWTVCAPPETFGGLADGEHLLEIRARDEAGNVDPEPLAVAWTIDNQPPVTVIDSAPPAVTSESDPAIGFTSSPDTAASYCRFDGGEWQSCASPVSPRDLLGEDLAEGQHRLAIRSVDQAGNVEVTHALSLWIQDTIAPSVELIAHPAENVPAGDADFGWTVKDGDPPAEAPEAGSECSLDDGEWEPCGRSFKVSSPTPGSHVFKVRASDAAGNQSPEVTREFNVAGPAPDAPAIDSADPPGGTRTSLTSATFAFSHSDQEAETFNRFECRLDQGAWTPCTSPRTETGLGDGEHGFQVRVVDQDGNVSATALSEWEVETSAPDTAIDGGPSGLVSQRRATILFSADRPGSFECRVDEGEWEPCASPLTLEDLADGEHRVAVRATSDVSPDGVTDPSPAVRTWTVDATAPATTITGLPAASSEERDATVAFVSDEEGAGFHCSLDGAPFTACESPLQLENLSYGEHQITVRAVDAAGNVDADPPSGAWTVLEPKDEGCPPGQVGAPPECVDPPDECAEGELGTPPDCRAGKVHLAVGAVRLSRQKVKAGGKVKLNVRLANRGEVASGKVRLCLRTPRKVIRGKPQRCLTNKGLAAGRSVTFSFELRTKRKLRRKKTVQIKVTAPTGSGKSHKTIARRLTVKRKGGKS